MATELIAEIGAEIAADPGKFVIEVVQFFVLLTIVWLVAFGAGKRKGFLAKSLDARRERLAERIDRAAGAEAELERCRNEARRILVEARQQSESILAEARGGGDRERAAARQATDEEVERIGRHARQVIESETAEMHVQMRDNLVELVAGATRSILNEGLSAQEQRELIQHSVAACTGDLERAAPSVAHSGAKGVV